MGVVMAGVGSHKGGLGGEVGLVNWGVNRGCVLYLVA